MYKAIFIAAILFVIATIMLNNNFEQFEHNNAVFVFDASHIETTKAKQIHNFLINQKAYDGKTGDVLLLTKTKAGVWVIKFPVYQGGEVSKKVLERVQSLALNIKQSMLNNEPVEIHITNSGYQSVQFFKI